MRIGVLHPGTQHSWQTALAFQESGQLAWYATSVFYTPNRWPYQLEGLLPAKAGAWLHAEFCRRYSPALDPARVRRFGPWEWLETGARRLGQDGVAGWCNVIGNRSFCRQVIKLIEREPVDLVWGYNSSSLEVFQWAKQRGITCVLDQTTWHAASQNRVALEEQGRNPEFFEESYRPLDPEWIGRQDQEMAAADFVVVGSQACARTMLQNGCPPDKIHLIPYGYDSTMFPRTPPDRLPTGGRPVQFLFVGEVGPMKGVAYLLRAFQAIDPLKAKLTLVGRLAIPRETFKHYASHVTHQPQVPRQAVARYFTGADCFIFPSLFEGGGRVLYEARGAGLGIIQSERCGDGVQASKNGVMLAEVSAASVQTVVEQVTAAPEVLEAWQTASWTLRKRRTWSVYRQALAGLLSHA